MDPINLLHEAVRVCDEVAKLTNLLEAKASGLPSRSADTTDKVLGAIKESYIEQIRVLRNTRSFMSDVVNELGKLNSISSELVAFTPPPVDEDDTPPRGAK